MQPTKFKGSELTIAENQKPYLPLPAHVDNCAEVVVTTCWRASFVERVVMFFTGRVYIQQMTFGAKLQPQKVSATNPTY